MIFNILFYGGLILCILFLIASVVLFFYLDIPKALGVITGQTEKKAIEEIRAGGRASIGRSRAKGGVIQARDVAAGDAKSDTLFSSFRKDAARSSDASEGLSKKAAEDAKAAVSDRAEKSRPRRSGDDEEATEVLTYSDTKQKATGEETTSILEEEQATDILSEDGDAATDVLTSSAAGYSSGDDDATDVLKSTDRASYNDEEEATDILRAASQEELYDDDLDEDIDDATTDVLTADMAEGLTSDDIYGTYNPEMTAVLRSDMTPGEESVKSGGAVNGITVLYSETIVHTDESL